MIPIPVVLWARIAGAVVVATFLAFTHYKAFHLGGADARTDLAEYKEQRSGEAFKVSEKYREKENALNLSNERIRNALAKEKAARATDAVATADRLRDYESTLDSLRAKDSTAGPGADDPPFAIARECAKQLIVLDQYAQGLASQTRGLQAYAREICRSE